MKDYIVAEIQPKDGVLKGVHEEMIGRPAYIVELEIGYPGVLKVLPEYDDRYHTIRTTNVLTFTSLDGEPDVVEIETRNTRYMLRAK
jgi:hypothetical protein